MSREPQGESSGKEFEVSKLDELNEAYAALDTAIIAVDDAIAVRDAARDAVEARREYFATLRDAETDEPTAVYTEDGFFYVKS